MTPLETGFLIGITITHAALILAWLTERRKVRWLLDWIEWRGMD